MIIHINQYYTPLTNLTPFYSEKFNFTNTIALKKMPICGKKADLLQKRKCSEPQPHSELLELLTFSMSAMTT